MDAGVAARCWATVAHAGFLLSVDTGVVCRREKLWLGYVEAHRSISIHNHMTFRSPRASEETNDVVTRRVLRGRPMFQFVPSQKCQRAFFF